MSSLLAGPAGAQVRYLPGDSVLSQAAGTQMAPHLSRGNTTTLAVWTDYRSNPYGSFDYETGLDVYGMRFDGQGNPLDLTPFPIAKAPGAQENPKVSWNGSDWLVVFESTGVGGTGYYQKGVAAARVSASGQVLDQRPIPLYGLGSNSGVQWDVATDGDKWVVACQGTSTYNGTVAVRVSSSGVVLDPPNRVFVPETYFLRFNLRLAYASGVFLLLMDGGAGGTDYVRFDSNLIALDLAPVRLLDWPATSVSSNGQVFLVTSVRQFPDFTMHVTGTRVNTLGQKLDGDGVDVSSSEFPQGTVGPFSTWTGSDWRVTWLASSSLRMASVLSDGTVSNPGGIAVSGPGVGPIAPASNGGIQTVWSKYSTSADDVLLCHVLPNGGTTGNKDVSVGVPRQVRSDSATNGNGYMVVFLSEDSFGTRVMAHPLDAAGNPTLPEPTVLASGPAVNGPTYPQVTWTGSNYMVAWGTGATVVAQRLRPDGSKVDPSPFVVMSGTFGPSDLAAIGDTVLVLGRKAFQGGQVITAYGARVRASDATVLDPTPLVLGGGYVSRPPVVTDLGGKFLVAFMSNWSHDNSIADTAGVFVPVQGAQGSSFAIHTAYSTAGGNGIFELGLASNGQRSVLVQSQELTSGVETDLLCRFIELNGAVTAYQNLTPWRGNQYRPRVAWDGHHFVIVYQEQKNRTAVNTLDQIDARGDLFGMRVSETGEVLDPAGFVFTARQDSETDPNVCSSNGKSLITGSLMDETPGKANYRVGYTFFGSAGNRNPVAVATATPNIGNVPLTVQFSSAGSMDPDGAIVSTNWDFGDGTSSSDPHPQHVYSAGVPHVARLVVTDASGAKTEQAILVWSKRANKPPVATGVATPTNGAAPLDVVMTAEKSYDPDGFVGNVRWVFRDDQSEYWGGTAYHTFPARGIWPVDLTVWDAEQATGSFRQYVVVGNTQSLAPTSVATTAGTYLSGDAASLGTSDDRSYVVREGISPFQGGPAAQFDVTYTLAQANPTGLTVRLEAASNATPIGALRQRVSAFNVQTGVWELLDDRSPSALETPFELAVNSGASRFVDAGTRTVRLRVSWTTTGLMAFRGWIAATDHARLTVLYP